MIQGISSPQGSWGGASATGKAGLAVSHKQPKPHRPFIPIHASPPSSNSPDLAPGSLCPSACCRVPPLPQDPESSMYSPHQVCSTLRWTWLCILAPHLHLQTLPPSVLPWSLQSIRPLFPPPLLASPSKQ